MKKFIADFLHRGLIVCWLGPIILTIVYLILQQAADLQTLTVKEVCVGIFSLTALAFVAGGMNAVYQLERLPLMVAILIHGSVLYVSYLITYLLNNWLDSGIIPIIVFSAVFVVGYIVIWAVIYLIIRTKTEKLNKKLKQKQQSL